MTQEGPGGTTADAPTTARRAVVVIDVAESVRIIERPENRGEHAIHSLVQRIRDEVLPAHEGGLVKSTGDGLLLTFDDVPDALLATLSAMGIARQLSAGRDADQQIRLRASIALSDVLIDELDARGAGVNVAYRLNGSAEPGQILLTAEANAQLHPSIDVATEDLGERWLKHLSEPVRCYRVCEQAPAVDAQAYGPPSEHALHPSIAVLPFRGDVRGGAEFDIGDLIANELIVALSQVPSLRVVSRLSTTRAARRSGAATQAAQLLGADFVVSGVCHGGTDHLVVFAEVEDVRRGVVLDRIRVGGDLAALWVNDSPLVAELIEGIGRALLARQVQLSQQCAVPNLPGYTMLLGGIALMHRLGSRDFARAEQLLASLAERWPRLPTPHAWLARWHLFSVIQGWSTDPGRSRKAAYDACQRALELDATSSVALAVAGSVQIQLAQDVDKGIALYEAALAHNPSDSLAWTLLGTAHAFKGEGGMATRATARAVRLSPIDPMHFLYDCHAASAALAAGDPARALLLAERSMRANAQHLSTYRVLALAQALTGDLDAARATVGKLRRLDPAYSVATWLRQSPSAAYEIGRRFASVLADAGLPLN